jgi:hypothetical protein
MKLKRSAESNRLLKAAAVDGISYICGLSGIPFPLETIRTVVEKVGKRSSRTFVDWKLEDWPRIYHSDRSALVRLPLHGRDVFLPQMLILDNTNVKYGLSDVALSIDSTPFRLRPDVRALTESSFKRLTRTLEYSNEENLRLIGMNRKSNRLELKLQRVYYEDYLRTNLVLDAKVAGKRETLRQYLHADGVLEELGESPLANNLGVNILAFTADGSLIVQKRSKKVAFRRGELCPSGSGTLAFGDVQQEATLDRVRLLREAIDEVGIRREDIKPHSTSLLGISRELIRGGQPEMFLTATVNVTESEVTRRWKHAREQWEATSLVFYSFGRTAFGPLNSPNSAHEFLLRVDGFVDEFIDHMSIPLLTNLALWVRSRLRTK